MSWLICDLHSKTCGFRVDKNAKQLQLSLFYCKKEAVFNYIWTLAVGRGKMQATVKFVTVEGQIEKKITAVFLCVGNYNKKYW